MIDERGKEISPCIVSKIKHALNVKNRYRYNSKRCSIDKWKEICNLIGKKNNKTKAEINKAIAKYSVYII